MSSASQNARIHGFTAEHIALSSEERPLFEALRDSLLAEFSPSGATEEFLFRRLLHAAWNLDRIDIAEAGLFLNVADMLLNEENEKIVAKFSRYRAAHLRVYQYARRSLEYEQTQRSLRQTAQAVHDGAKQLPTIPPAANFQHVSSFAKQARAHEKFSTIPPEIRDELEAMALQTRHGMMQLRTALFHRRAGFPQDSLSTGQAEQAQARQAA